MNIIWLTKLTDKDPFRNTQLMMSDALRKHGNEVTLVLARNFAEKKEKHEGMVYLPTLDIKFLSGLLFGFIVFFSLPGLLKKKKIDIIFVSGDTIWSPFFLPIRFFGIPLIMDMRSLPIDSDMMKLKNSSLYLSRFLVDGVTTITPELAIILQKKFHFVDTPIGIWSSGFSKDQFRGVQQDLIDTAFKDKFVVMHHGTYSPSRGIEELIRAIPLVNDAVKKQIVLLLVGIPQEKIEDLQNLCQTLGISKLVTIIPPVEIKKIPSYIQQCDVGVIPLPPDNEWWHVSVPLKSLEYLAMGKPVIATSIPFHQKIFELCDCGVLINTNKPEEIGRAIDFLYEQKEKLVDMGKKGREVVEKYYSWESKALEVEEYLRQFV
jgi:glycosyltransferase involved in cell wall biosynthesis